MDVDGGLAGMHMHGQCRQASAPFHNVNLSITPLGNGRLACNLMGGLVLCGVMSVRWLLCCGCCAVRALPLACVSLLMCIR